MKMKFRAHDTFFIRKSWLSKGMRNIQNDPAVFIGTNGNPMDILGMGANMVKALRYWMQAVRLTDEKLVDGHRQQQFTQLGYLVLENDPYIEELGTLCILHYKLCTNKEDATAWYFFFNEFRFSEFTRDDFVTQLNNYIRINGEDVSVRSLEDDYNCIINTYVPRIKLAPEKIQPESNIDCPLGELGLIDISNRKNKLYRKNSPKNDALHPLILLAVIVEQAAGQNEVKISSIQNEFCNAGKVYNLDVISLINLLYKIELLGYIKVVRTAGLDVVRFESDIDFIGCIKEYYRSINN